MQCENDGVLLLPTIGHETETRDIFFYVPRERYFLGEYLWGKERRGVYGTVAKADTEFISGEKFFIRGCTC